MNFQVIWQPDAEQELTRIWLGSRIRARISEAASSIDQALRRDPSAIGESRENQLRVIFDRPLAVEVEIHESRMPVLVLAVWEIPEV